MTPAHKAHWSQRLVTDWNPSFSASRALKLVYLPLQNPLCHAIIRLPISRQVKHVAVDAEAFTCTVRFNTYISALIATVISIIITSLGAIPIPNVSFFLFLSLPVGLSCCYCCFGYSSCCRHYCCGSVSARAFYTWLRLHHGCELAHRHVAHASLAEAVRSVTLLAFVPAPP